MCGQVRLKPALDIVELDKTAFENAVAKGEYTVVPPTSRGSPRLFGEADLVPLWIFARLIEARGDHSRERLSVKEAGKVVRRIADAIEHSPSANHIAVVTHMNDLIRAFDIKGLDLDAIVRTGASSGAKVRDIRIWDVRNIREIAAKGIADQEQIAGSD